MKETNHQSVLTSFRIFLQLLRRDLMVLRTKYRRMATDACFVVATQVIVFGKLFPLLGMSPELTAPIYLGTATSFSFFLGFSLSSAMTEDLERARFIDYQLTLPISKGWVLAKYIASFAIENGLIVAPAVVVATGILAGFGNLNIIAFILFYPVMLCFSGLLFLMFGMRYPPQWSRSNIWPRRLTPLLFFSATISPWFVVHAFSPTVAYLMLLNPISYAAEGMRGALLGGNYLPTWLCISAFALFAIPLTWLLNKSVNLRLDPV